MYFRSCLDFLLSLSENVPSTLWEEFQSSVKVRKYLFASLDIYYYFIAEVIHIIAL